MTIHYRLPSYFNTCENLLATPTSTDSLTSNHVVQP